jgi:hypothetical protein
MSCNVPFRTLSFIYSLAVYTPLVSNDGWIDGYNDDMIRILGKAF